MSVTDAVMAGRVAREAIMLDACIVTEPGAAAPVFNETTGNYDVPARNVIYEGKCRVQVKADINSNVVEATSGDREQTYQTSTLELPVDGTSAVRTNHLATITFAALDEGLLGRQYQIQGNYQKSQAVCRRYRVKESAG